MKICQVKCVLKNSFRNNRHYLVVVNCQMRYKRIPQTKILTLFFLQTNCAKLRSHFEKVANVCCRARAPLSECGSTQRRPNNLERILTQSHSSVGILGTHLLACLRIWSKLFGQPTTPSIPTQLHAGIKQTEDGR